MKLLFDLKFLTILYKNYQFETITFQNEIMTFQDLIIVRNLFYNHCTSYSIHFIFPFCKPFLKLFLNVADFCNQIKKKIEYDYQKMTLYYLKEYKGVFNERI